MLYLYVFVILIALTLVEVGAAYVEMDFNTTIAILFFMGAGKIAFIALFYMHLRWEPLTLRLVSLIPVFFILSIIIGIGMTHPGATSTFHEHP